MSESPQAVYSLVLDLQQIFLFKFLGTGCFYFCCWLFVLFGNLVSDCLCVTLLTETCCTEFLMSGGQDATCCLTTLN